MINKKDFSEMRKEMVRTDSQRERLIKISRSVVKLSKQLIFSIHRSDMNSASSFAKKMANEFNNMRRITQNFPELRYSSLFRDACQEYVEAIAYFKIIREKRLPTKKEVGVDTESYLLGICDLTGEIVRAAINAAIKNDFVTAIKMREFVNELYGVLLGFDFKNHLRRKFDSIKYDLKKLEDLMFSLKMKEK